MRIYTVFNACLVSDVISYYCGHFKGQLHCKNQISRKLSNDDGHANINDCYFSERNRESCNLLFVYIPV